MVSDVYLFEVLKRALKEFANHDEQLLSWPKARASIAHALAMHLKDSATLLGEGMYIDILAEGSDVVIHDRSGSILMALVLSTTYLNGGQQKQLQHLYQRGSILVFGIAFLKEKEYFLLYRPRRDAIDYYHYRKAKQAVVRLRERNSAGDEGQLLLGIQSKTKRRRSSTVDR